MPENGKTQLTMLGYASNGRSGDPDICPWLSVHIRHEQTDASGNKNGQSKFKLETSLLVRVSAPPSPSILRMRGNKKHSQSEGVRSHVAQQMTGMKEDRYSLLSP